MKGGAGVTVNEMGADIQERPQTSGDDQADLKVAPKRFYWASKRAADIAVSLALLPAVALIGLCVLIANLFANPGPLIFKQTRMGRGCRPFTVYKFRSMLPHHAPARGPEDPVEVDRITSFGHFLRRTHLDETPQLFNVLKGDMSLIGPRPDVYEHALRFAETVSVYPKRHAVRPGITGLSQVTFGYVEGTNLTSLKARTDILYIRSASWLLDARIVVRTIYVMSLGRGGKTVPRWTKAKADPQPTFKPAVEEA
ncbi:MAG: sugar transferase [Pseudomonadota bacterium]